ncbi:MAG: hypothetical protein ACKORY_02765, partial [Actinomycetota bacterium]
RAVTRGAGDRCERARRATTCSADRPTAQGDRPRWGLHRATLVSLDESLFAAAGLPAPSGDPHCMWSPGVPVRIGLPRRA